MTFLLALVIAVLTLMPMRAGGSGVPGSDKLHHFLAFACLAFPLPLLRPRWTFWVILAVVFYGGAIELLQPFFGRQAEWADLLADAVGAVVGAVVARQLGMFLRRYLRENKKPFTLSREASRLPSSIS